jgi:hypothetical protein
MLKLTQSVPNGMLGQISDIERGLGIEIASPNAIQTANFGLYGFVEVIEVVEVAGLIFPDSFGRNGGPL